MGRGNIYSISLTGHLSFVEFAWLYFLRICDLVDGCGRPGNLGVSDKRNCNLRRSLISLGFYASVLRLGERVLLTEAHSLRKGKPHQFLKT